MLRRISYTLNLLKYNKKAAIGLSAVIFFIATSLLCPLFIDYSKEVIKYNAENKYKSPSSSNWFGTDQFGRDVFKRVLWGTRTAIYVGLSSVLIGMAIGVPFGMFSGFWGGWRDDFLMRINDALLSFPALLLALLIISALGSNVLNAIIAIGLAFVPRIARIMRSCTISIKSEQFVSAAMARGESDAYIIFKEILPNALGPMVVEGGIRISYAIIVGAGLSFMGLGTQPPTPDWGLMIYEARQQIYISPWTLIFPSIALTLMIVSFNTLGDALRDFFDPKEKKIIRIEL